MEDPFNEKCQKVFKNECFSMIHMNIRSLPANLNHFMNYLNCLNVQFSVLCFSETWLNANNHDLYALPGYSHIGKHRPHRSGGGVSLFIKERFTYKSRLDISIFNDVIESVFVEMNIPTCNGCKEIIIGVIYRPPNTCIEKYTDILNDIQNKIKMETKICYILGDYHIDLLKCDFHKPSSEFLTTMYENSFYNLINRPTRNAKTTATLIDNIFTNNMKIEIASLSGILLTNITDHYAIFHAIEVDKKARYRIYFDS